MNDPHFLFVLAVILISFLDEDRRTYSLCRICVLSLITLVALRITCFSYRADDNIYDLLVQRTDFCYLFFTSKYRWTGFYIKLSLGQSHRTELLDGINTTHKWS